MGIEKLLDLGNFESSRLARKDKTLEISLFVTVSKNASDHLPRHIYVFKRTQEYPNYMGRYFSVHGYLFKYILLGTFQGCAKKDKIKSQNHKL